MKGGASARPRQQAAATAYAVSTFRQTQPLVYNEGDLSATGDHTRRPVARRRDTPSQVGPLLTAAVGPFYAAEQSHFGGLLVAPGR